jgi:hypothetical protein
MAPRAARTVLEAADEGDAATAAAKRPRVLKRQSTEQAVAKALRDNCAGMTPQEVDGVRVSGKTLREKLLSDKREARIGSRAEPMGRKYYDGLRETYSSMESPKKALLCGDDTLTVNQDLFAAMLAAKKTPPARHHHRHHQLPHLQHHHQHV